MRVGGESNCELVNTIVRTRDSMHRPPLVPHRSRNRMSKVGPDASFARSPTAEGVPRWDRRTMLAAMLAAGGAAGGVAGCGREQPSEEASDADLPEIPLRVVWVGTIEEFEIVRRAWAGVSPLPLAVSTIDAARDDPAGLCERLSAAATKADVMVYPLAALAELATAGRAAEWQGVTGADADADRRPVRDGQAFDVVSDPPPLRLPPALRHAAAEFAGQPLALPLGTRQVAWMVSGELPGGGRWQQDYDAWVADSDGAASEPLAGGWAAAMYLLRAANSPERSWLFDRDSFEPLLGSDSYVAVLEQMRVTATRYRDGRQTPEEIWAAVRGERLRGGLGFPAGEDRDPAGVQFLDPPRDGDGKRILLDPFTTVGSLSTACRQTAASKRFLDWLAGGPGSEPVRRQLARLTLPPGIGQAPVAETTTARSDAYLDWLSLHLQTAVIVPTLRLHRAGDYYAILDRAVVDCLDGKSSPAEALGEAARLWRETTREVGRDRQQRAWQRAQGMAG